MMKASQSESARNFENTSCLPAEAHTARCTTATVGCSTSAKENWIVLFSGICGGTCPKQQRRCQDQNRHGGGYSPNGEKCHSQCC